MDNNINLKTFLKYYTAVNESFIDEYYKFYELCEKNYFGIDVDLVIKYLGIVKVEEFYERLRNKFKENIDYVKEIKQNTKKIKGYKIITYYINIDTFERICMSSHAIKANNVRDYFIILRKFIQYYKNNISNMIIDKTYNLIKGIGIVIIVLNFN